MEVLVDAAKAANVRVALCIMVMKFMMIVVKQSCNRIEVIETSIQQDADIGVGSSNRLDRKKTALQLVPNVPGRYIKN